MSPLRRSFLLAVLVAAVAAVPANSTSTLAEFGTYSGHDSSGRSISFEYAYDSLVNFHRGGSYFISQATVTNASFDKTEGHHTAKGSWTSATTLSGTITYLVVRQTSTGTVFERVTKSWTASRQGGT